MSYIFKTASSFSLEVVGKSLIGRFFISHVFAGNTTMCPVQYVARNLRVERDCSKEKYMAQNERAVRSIGIPNACNIFIYIFYAINLMN